MNFFKDHWVGLVAMIIALGSLFGGAQLFGAANPTGPQHFQQEAFIQGLAAGSRNQWYINGSGNVSSSGTWTLGSSGTAQSNQVITTCSMMANNGSIGTSTQYAYCTGVTGVTSADFVNADFATSSTIANDQWVITGAKASTTAGAIDFRILNLTGIVASKAMSAATTIGSTTVIHVSH